MNEMASGDVIFSATGVTDGSLLDGVHFRRRVRRDRDGGDALQNRHRAPHQDQLPHDRHEGCALTGVIMPVAAFTQAPLPLAGGSGVGVNPGG